MAYEISTLMTNSKDKTVLLRLRNNKTVTGTLKDFDIHMNLTLENAEETFEDKSTKLETVLIRGDNILAVSLPKEDP